MNKVKNNISPRPFTLLRPHRIPECGYRGRGHVRMHILEDETLYHMK